MLRVGLTGGLGSGKSTVATLLRQFGAHVLEADELGRALMEPGESVYRAIVQHFGENVVQPDGRLDRARLAQIAFGDGRLQELNALVHPAVIQAQQEWMEALFQHDPAAVAVIESALILEVERDARARGEVGTVLSDWRNRLDRLIVVTAPEEMRTARYVARVAATTEAASAERDARQRIGHQVRDDERRQAADFLVENTGDLAHLETVVRSLWPQLVAESNNRQSIGF